MRVVSPAGFCDRRRPDGCSAQCRDGAEVWLGIRPHDIQLTAPDDADATAAVEIVEPLGPHATLHVRLAQQGGELVRVQVAAPVARPVGSAVGLRFARERVHLFDRATGRRLG